MLVVIEKKFDKRKVNKLISDIKPSKIFEARKFSGKISWNEEPLEYQKRLRDEWN